MNRSKRLRICADTWSWTGWSTSWTPRRALNTPPTSAKASARPPPPKAVPSPPPKAARGPPPPPPQASPSPVTSSAYGDYLAAHCFQVCLLNIVSSSLLLYSLLVAAELASEHFLKCSQAPHNAARSHYQANALTKDATLEAAAQTVTSWLALSIAMHDILVQTPCRDDT
ncbi:hypothetical protein MMC29_003591 [Sticta canariensis]|nr:hypothetical protein [Sticta canariensis]